VWHESNAGAFGAYAKDGQAVEELSKERNEKAAKVLLQVFVSARAALDVDFQSIAAADWDFICRNSSPLRAVNLNRRSSYA
jgi:hypothetical protein